MMHLTLAEIDKIPFFFILGRPRSGTTLVRTLFDAHPNVMIPIESTVILHLYPKYGDTRIWDDVTIQMFIADLYTIKKFPLWMVDNRLLETSLRSLGGSASFQQVVKAVYLCYPTVFPKEKVMLIGDKNPLYSNFAPSVFRIFPDAKYIHLYRDPRDNIASIMKFDFSPPVVPLLAWRWQYSYRTIVRLKKQHPESFRTIKYESFVEDPARYLNELCEFLGIPYREEVLTFHKQTDEIYASRTEEQRQEMKKYHSALEKPVNTSNIGKWKEKLGPREVQVIDMVCGKAMKDAGYASIYPGFRLWPYLRITPMLLYSRGLETIGHMIDFLPHRLQLRIRNKKSVVTRLYTRYYLWRQSKKKR